MGRSKVGGGSSLLAALPAVILWVVLAVLCAAWDQQLLASLFAFLFLLTGAARLWGQRAARGVSVELTADAVRLFPGAVTRLTWTIRNDKLLPLIWLELSQNRAERDCLVPENGFEQYSYPVFEGENVTQMKGWRRTFSFVLGHQTLSADSLWRAERRGLYRPDRLLLRSGDGFGLTQMEQACPAERIPEFVIYPRRVPVNIDLFLRNDWEQTVGSSGHREDMTVLRGLRPYAVTDSWKRINWRMLARQPRELRVNFYETIQPTTALFLLDGESYGGAEEELEEVLEVLASVISRLFDRGICCGLCLPRSRRFGPVSLPPSEERSAGELLYYLAGYDCLAEHPREGETLLIDRYLPSRFDLAGTVSAASVSGMTAIFTGAPDSLPTGLLSHLPGHGVVVFSSGETRSADPELTVFPMNRLREEAEG